MKTSPSFLAATVVLSSFFAVSAGRALYDATPSPIMTPTPKPKTKRAPITFTVKTDKKTYRVGENASFAITVRNVSKSAQPLTFSSGQSFDIIARNAKGQVVWQWARGKMFTMSVREEVLDKGKTMVFNATWSHDGQSALAPGVYTIEAKLKSIEQKLAATTQIAVKTK